jgi:uncharacterized membrane protein YcaP (DUF421 family)
MNASCFHIQDWLGLGVDPKELTLLQLILRSVIVFSTMYLLIRIAGRRFMAQKNAFDVMLAFLVASVLARVVNGSASFWANILLGFVIAITYRAVAWLACEYPQFGRILKGRAVNVIVEGEVEHQVLKRHHVSLHDLEEDLRLAGNVGDPHAVKLARLERSGEISVERKAQVLHVTVQNGVQVVELRIQ